MVTVTVLVDEISNWFQKHRPWYSTMKCWDPFLWQEICGNLQDVHNHGNGNEEEEEGEEVGEKKRRRRRPSMFQDDSFPISTVVLPQMKSTAGGTHMEDAITKGMMQAKKSNDSTVADEDALDLPTREDDNNDDSSSSNGQELLPSPPSSSNVPCSKERTVHSTTNTKTTAASTTAQTIPSILRIPQDHEDYHISQTVSELTMQSLGEAYWNSLSLLGAGGSSSTNMNNRRMAYYAIGPTIETSTNHQQPQQQLRQCYFTGTPILSSSSSPFYAGILHRNLQSLVVLCAYTSIELPPSPSATTNCCTFLHEEQQQLVVDYLRTRYPKLFSQLPSSLRQPSSWKLYTKFCSFSGLPIAEGEMHYRVSLSSSQRQLSNQEDTNDDIMINEDILLSHELMVAIHGETSAELLKLPNTKTLTYLSTYYPTQSKKYPPSVFVRDSWEAVLPEC